MKTFLGFTTGLLAGVIFGAFVGGVGILVVVNEVNKPRRRSNIRNYTNYSNYNRPYNEVKL